MYNWRGAAGCIANSLLVHHSSQKERISGGNHGTILLREFSRLCRLRCCTGSLCRYAYSNKRYRSANPLPTLFNVIGKFVLEPGLWNHFRNSHSHNKYKVNAFNVGRRDGYRHYNSSQLFSALGVHTLSLESGSKALCSQSIWPRQTAKRRVAAFSPAETGIARRWQQTWDGGGREDVWTSCGVQETWA